MPLEYDDIAPTDEQAAILDAFEAGKYLAVTALAGCLSADTLIRVNRGGKGSQMPISHVAHMHYGGRQAGRIWSPAVETRVGREVDGVMRLAPMSDAWYSGEKLTYELTTETGRMIRATAAHPFMLANGRFARLEMLDPGDELRVEIGQSKRGSAPKKHYRYVTTHHHPHQGINSISDGNFKVLLHHAVMEAAMNNLSYNEFIDIVRNDPARSKELIYLDPGLHVHHRDQNHLNNQLDNLMVMTAMAHAQEHSAESTNNVLYRIGTEVIASINEFGVEPTYDIEVADDPHNFLANGFVVHNTGKTSTLRMCGETARRRKGIYLAFNRSIADEAEATFETRVTCRTAHSFAMRAMGGPYRHRLNGPRMPPWDVARIMGIKDFHLETKTLHATRMASLTREMVSRFCHSSDTEVGLHHVPFVRGLETRMDPVSKTVIPDEHPLLAEELLPFARVYWMDICSLEGMFRFEHDHYLKIWALTHPKMAGDFLLVDEAQDLNGVLVGLVEDQDHMQQVIVGDANQQIYGWRGSLNAMEVFPVDETLPLTQSWRFGPEIAGAANVFLEQLGSELRISGNPDKISTIGPSITPDAVLCRTNGGSLEMAMHALMMGRWVHIAGNRPAQMMSFCEAVVKMQARQIVHHPDLSSFQSWQEVVNYTQVTSDPEFTMMVRLILRYGVERLIQALRALVPAGKADLVISTAHSAKGLEWGEVRLGQDFGSKDEDGEPGTERIITPEETRLRYVAVTRAMDVLDPGPLTTALGLEDSDGSDGSSFGPPDRS